MRHIRRFILMAAGIALLALALVAAGCKPG